MMKKCLLIPLALLALVSCKEKQAAPRPTTPMVHAIAADTAGLGRLVGQSGRRGGEGSVALIGEPGGVIALARRFQGCDRVDNVDGRPVRDSLPDFAGETFDAIIDARFTPYSRLLASDPDSLRDAAVINSVAAWDSVCWRSRTDAEPLLRKQCAKLIILTSPLQAQWGKFDVDTLQQMCGGRCFVLSPVHVMLDEAYAAGARSIAVWTTRDVRDSGAWEAVFAQKGWADTNLSVLAPEPAVDVRTELRSLLRQYRESGRVLDALLVDSYDVDLVLLRSELNLIKAEGTLEDASFQAMISPDFVLLDPATTLIGATYATMREHHLFTHRIARPSVQYFETAESAEGLPRLISISSAYAQSTYVPNLD
ncbi:MAG: hypothetical protein K5843_00035 [Bacteroidales bacterium]|nr:hypothetical protein [Bacteroidales bacterium]